MNWKRLLFIGVCIALGVYLLLAVTVINRSPKADMVCNDVRVTIEKGVVEGFLTPDEVKRMLVERQLYPVGKSMSSVDLRTMEESLLSNELIEDAECYKAQNGTVDINIRERVPVVRVMANNGADYYVDSQGHTLQNTGYSCNAIVATGHIDPRYSQHVLAPIGQMVMTDEFWRNQIVQFNVLSDSTLEMVPRVGNHIIYIGEPVNVAKKLDRLRKFYRYGLSEAGWNKYSRISVEFDNQIVCKKR